MSDDLRIVRVPLRVELIRRMDKLILAGKGGYGSRAEFIQEAVEALVLESTYPEAEGPGGDEVGGHDVIGGPLKPTTDMFKEGESKAADHPMQIGDTIIRAPVRGYILEAGVAELVGDLMFGLHNRDYPSIWAASRIATRTGAAPMQIDSLLDEVVREAWQYARKLARLEKTTSEKLTALFPTNENKRQAASSAFLTFAVGKCDVDLNNGRVVGRGPLFEWGVVQVEKHDGHLVAGITPTGYELLEALDGISLDLPHAPEFAAQFIRFLKCAAPADWRGFELVLAAGRDGDGRTELIDRFCREHSGWDARKANNYATGYVARAREWGLLEAKLVNRKYQLTELGRQQT